MGPSADDADLALRVDVRRISTLLGHSLVRQEGPELLELVETVRTLTRTDPAAAAELLRDVDEQTAARLVRAFNAYFHLANVVEQVHRGRELRRRRAADGGWLWRTARLIAERSVPVDELERVARKLEVRPVFTAHPTEAARRSTLTKLHALADLLDAEAAEAALAPGPDLAERTDRRLSEVIDLLWLTDELRRERPEPVDEARNAVFHLVDAERLAVPEVLADVAAVFARFGVELPVTAAPLRFGTWTGGDRDGNPNVTPAVTMQVLTLQHDQGIRVVERALEVLVEELSVSSRVGGVSDELLASLQEDLERLPEVDPRFRRINAEEPYRLKISCIRAKLARTRARLAAGAAGQHEPGADYLGSAALVADLELLRRSLAVHHGELIAEGRLAAIVRTDQRDGHPPGDDGRPRARRCAPPGHRRHGRPPPRDRGALRRARPDAAPGLARARAGRSPPARRRLPSPHRPRRARSSRCSGPSAVPSTASAPPSSSRTSCR